MKTEEGIKNPIVNILSYTPVAVAEIAARVCYDSFGKGGDAMQHFGKNIRKLSNDDIQQALVSKDTVLLRKLVWVNHHTSVSEHVHVNILCQDVSRGVLHHQVRHRMQNISVRSTRYTMTDLAVVMSILKKLKLIEDEAHSVNMLAKVMEDHNVLVCTKKKDIDAEALYFYSKNKDVVVQEDVSKFLSKEQIAYMDENVTLKTTNIYEVIDIMSKLKTKRNVGDLLKDGVTDAWATIFTATLNLSSLQNYMRLRLSGASLNRTQNLAKTIFDSLPDELVGLVVKKE